MTSDLSLDYRTAGVDIDVADAAKERIRRLVESTTTPGVRGEFGGFGGMFRVPGGTGKGDQLLVSSVDGVGTKLAVAVAAGRHNSVGHDLVNHCTNDILVQGARPLFFLDYLAFGVLDPVVAEAVVAGVAAGCRENGCALIGGETAEMPNLYTPPNYDLAGCIVGVVAEADVLGAARVQLGDAIIGLASSGLHTNGYSLARRIVAERLRLSVTDRFPGAADQATVAEVLLRVHRSYLASLGPVLRDVHALAHITGGGIPGNLPRVLPPPLDAAIAYGSWPVPIEFSTLMDAGHVDWGEMLRTFNMGIGMVVVAPPSAVDRIVAHAASVGVAGWTLGEIVQGTGRVVIS